MENVILFGVLVAIFGGVIWYIVKAQKRGQKCIGCPHSATCGGNCGDPKEPFDKIQ